MSTDTVAPELTRRSLTGVQYRDDATGEVTAHVIRKGVENTYGETVETGFVGDQDVMLLHMHNGESDVIGRGRLFDNGDDWVDFEGRYFLDQPAARARFEQHRAVADLMEWSYGFVFLPGGRRWVEEPIENTADGDEGEPETRRRLYLQPLDDGSPGCIAKEVSTVIFGADRHTSTVALRDGSQKFTDQVAAALAAVEDVVTRAASLAELRGQEGRLIGADTVDRLEELHKRLGALVDSQARPLPGPTVLDLAVVRARQRLREARYAVSE